MKRLAVLTLFALLWAAPASAKLFAADAGFSQARQGGTVLVTRYRGYNSILRTAITYWNQAAGRELLRLAPKGTVGQITSESLVCSHLGCAEAYPGWSEPYSSCAIWVRRDILKGSIGWNVTAHEFGHCLGLDHDTAGVMGGATPDLEYDAEVLKQAGYV